ncbi:MAG: hypothetical protein ACOC80_00575, partial [Petrotogales bacterium]
MAIGFSWDKGVVCIGSNSHTETLPNEDEYCKIEIILDDSKPEGYSIEADDNYSKDDFNKFKDCFTKTGKIKKPLLDYIHNWIKRNEVQFWKWMCKNVAYQKAKKIKNYFQKAKRIRNNHQKAEYIYNDCQKAEYIYNDSQKAKRIRNNYQKAEYIWNDSQEAKRIRN